MMDGIGAEIWKSDVSCTACLNSKSSASAIVNLQSLSTILHSFCFAKTSFNDCNLILYSSSNGLKQASFNVPHTRATAFVPGDKLWLEESLDGQVYFMSTLFISSSNFYQNLWILNVTDSSIILHSSHSYSWTLFYNYFICSNLLMECSFSVKIFYSLHGHFYRDRLLYLASWHSGQDGCRWRVYYWDRWECFVI
jgi:hypothetical protein